MEEKKLVRRWGGSRGPIYRALFVSHVIALGMGGYFCFSGFLVDGDSITGLGLAGIQRWVGIVGTG